MNYPHRYPWNISPHVPYAEFLLLTAVWELSLPTQEEVGYFTNTSKSLVSQRVSALKKKGLIRQELHDDNRRKVKLYLTDAGESKVRAIYKAMVNSSDPLFGSLGKDRNIFKKCLRLLAGELELKEEKALPEGI